MVNNHAFAKGETFLLSKKNNFFLLYLSKIFYYIIKKILKYIVSDSFKNSNIKSNDLKLGYNAWCHNNKSSTNVKLGNGVVCRGVIRIEDWANGNIVISDNVYIGDNVIISVADSIYIGNNVLIAHGVQIFDNNTHPTNNYERLEDYNSIKSDSKKSINVKSKKIIINDNVWIGFNSTILKGVNIGKNSIIASNSLITSDVPENSIYGGNPAKLLKSI
jgi:acetyltransferase-like isoleucine patch superfamily enzyme